MTQRIPRANALYQVASEIIVAVQQLDGNPDALERALQIAMPRFESLTDAIRAGDETWDGWTFTDAD